MDSYLRFAIENNASDCFISTGKPAAFRVLGEVISADADPVEAGAINNFRLKVIGVRGNEKYRESESADTSYRTEDGLRFRRHAPDGRPSPVRCVTAAIWIFPHCLCRKISWRRSHRVPGD